MASFGTVMWFSFSKGFGFCSLDSGASAGADIKDVFIHRSMLASGQIRLLNEGTTLSFNIEVTEKGPECRDVEIIEAVTPVRAERPVYPDNAIHCGGMPVGTTEEDLAGLFSGFQTTHVSVVPSRADSRASHGVVCLESADDVEDAIAEVNGSTMGDMTIVVEAKRTGRGRRGGGGGGGEGGEGGEGAGKKRTKKKRAKKPLPDIPPFALHIGNLSWNVDDETFAGIFAAYNTSFLEVTRQSPGGRSRGFGVVCMEAEADMAQVIADVNGKEVDGRELLVEAKQAKNEE